MFDRAKVLVFTGESYRLKGRIDSKIVDGEGVRMERQFHDPGAVVPWDRSAVVRLGRDTRSFFDVRTPCVFYLGLRHAEKFVYLSLIQMSSEHEVMPIVPRSLRQHRPPACAEHKCHLGRLGGSDIVMAREAIYRLLRRGMQSLGRPRTRSKGSLLDAFGVL